MNVFYHGTSSIFNIRKFILPPVDTNNLREDWRKKNLDVVYITTSLLSAMRYARKASEKYGGDPIVYEVKPLGFWAHRIDAEYIAEKALVLSVVKQK
ncbi:MAG: hypothetical protein IJ444_07480 [Kiritimatiellae bacterium]|nr:hypothetical protein [Kiritimatiellia bacterium]